jgi:DNA gyrase inhibitor GyrI
MLKIIASLVLLGATLGGPLASQVEQAHYTVVEAYGAIEIRDYPPMRVAEVEVSGERTVAIRQGFRILADYIFGNNIPAQKVSMTTPVTQHAKREKIAMTAPVTQTSDGKSWVVRFVMPASYTLQTLPKPSNNAVRLKELPKSRFVVVRFSGLAGAQSLKKHTAELESFISAHTLKAKSAPIYAFFNPPWTLPFLRRNEVMIEIY